MPRIKSAKKALRQSETRRAANFSKMRALKNVIKDCRKAAEAGKSSEANEMISKVYKALDKSAKTNLIKKNKASRLKSRLTHLTAKSSKASA